MSEMSDEEREPFIRQALNRRLELSTDGMLTLLRLLDAERAKVARVESDLRTIRNAAVRELSSLPPNTRTALGLNYRGATLANQEPADA